MAFQDRAYDTDQGFTAIVRQSTAEATASGAAGGDIDASFHVYSSGSRRRFGIHARGARLSRVVGTAPNQFTKTSFLAYPTVAAYDAANVGETVTIGGTTWTIASKVPESTV